MYNVLFTSLLISIEWWTRDGSLSLCFETAEVLIDGSSLDDVCRARRTRIRQEFAVSHHLQ